MRDCMRDCIRHQAILPSVAIMAHQLRTRGRFGFRNIQLVKSEETALGTGSYGAVYRARCDQLVCAAKVLHPILFQSRDPAAYRIVERFQREIDFLSSLRHPNIIQFLGSCTDPDSGLPVLFMELMDQSLTKFLEQAAESPPLPLHVQVDIAHDVAQALSHLHFHEVLHRDLSSNNVLLIGSQRAKVTDFGMAKLLGSDPHLTPTYCPGTNAYMSPEALADPPAYTSKLDVFSCGVLFVQLITRKWPNPGSRTYTVQVGNDPRFPSGRVLVEVPELERRKEHLDLISPTHPLLEVALDCLKDRESQRPTADQLCCRLISLKESTAYNNSLQQPPEETTLLAGYWPLEQQLMESKSRVENLTKEVQQLNKLVHKKDEEIGENKRELLDLQQKMQSRELKVGGGMWNYGPAAPFKTYGHSVAVSGEIVYCCDCSSGSKVQMFNSNTGQWKVLPECPKTLFSIAVVNGRLTAIGGHLDEVTNTLLSLESILQHSWIERFPPMIYGHTNPAVATTKRSLIVAGGSGRDGKKSAVEVMDTNALQWSMVASLPHPLSQATAVICGDSLFVGGGFVIGGATRSVLMVKLTDLFQHQSGSSHCSTSHQGCTWKEIASLPVVQSSLVAFKGQLLAIGGETTATANGYISEVKKYDATKNSWNTINEMRVERCYCHVAVLGNSTLFVCGGITTEGHAASVEMCSL